MYSSTNLFPATSSPPNPVSRAAHWFQTSTRPSRSIPKIGAFALRGVFVCARAPSTPSARSSSPCFSRHRAVSEHQSVSRLDGVARTRRETPPCGDSHGFTKTPSTRRLKLILRAEARVSINLELSLSWMFRAKRRRPVGGDVAPRRARNLATPSLTSEGSSSAAPASQHLKQTSASALDRGEVPSTSPSSSQAARNRFTASSDAWLWPAHLYSPEAFASTEHFRASAAARDTCEVPSPSSSKVAARRLARVVRARLRG